MTTRDTLLNHWYTKLLGMPKGTERYRRLKAAFMYMAYGASARTIREKIWN